MIWTKPGASKPDAQTPEAITKARGRAVEAPQTFSTILVATDLSARSDRALARAVSVALAHDASLVALHVVDEDLPTTVLDRVVEAADQEISAALQQADAGRGCRMSTVVVRGKDYQDILAKADALHADLIVLGAHRHESGPKPIQGTTMERVIRHGRRPVLVASNRVDGPYGSVMVGVDFSVFSRCALRTAWAFAPEARLSAVHAFHTPFEGFQVGEEMRRSVKADHEREMTAMIDEELDALIAFSGPDGAPPGGIDKVVRHGDPHRVLRDEVIAAKPDLLVLGTHGRVGLSHAVLGSVAEAFLNQPPCDVLVVKAW